MIQTEPTSMPKECILNDSNVICYVLMQEAIDKLCFQGKGHILELRGQVERWCCLGGEESRWIQMVEASVRDAERFGDLNYLKLALSKFEEKKSAGEYLLHRLNTWTIDDYPSNVGDAIIAFKARSDLLIYVAKVLGFTERWIGVLKDRLGRLVDTNDSADNLREECIVEAELLSDMCYMQDNPSNLM